MSLNTEKLKNTNSLLRGNFLAIYWNKSLKEIEEEFGINLGLSGKKLLGEYLTDDKNLSFQDFGKQEFSVRKKVLRHLKELDPKNELKKNFENNKNLNWISFKDMTGTWEGILDRGEIETEAEFVKELVERSMKGEMVYSELKKEVSGEYKSKNLETALMRQNANAKVAGILESITNGKDAMGALDSFSGQFGMGVKQLLMWLDGGYGKNSELKVVTQTKDGERLSLQARYGADNQFYFRFNPESGKNTEIQESGTVITLENTDVTEKERVKIKKEIIEKFKWITDIDVIYVNDKGHEEIINSQENLSVYGDEKENIERTKALKITIKDDFIEIRDSGSGMNGELLQKMFIPGMGKGMKALDKKDIQKIINTKLKLILSENTEKDEVQTVSFLRNQESIYSIDIPDDRLNLGNFSMGFELGPLLKVSEARSGMDWDKNVIKALPILIEKRLEDDRLSVEEKVMTLNSVARVLEAMGGENEDSKTTTKFIQNLKKTQKALSEVSRKFLEDLKNEGYKFVPNLKVYRKLKGLGNDSLNNNDSKPPLILREEDKKNKILPLDPLFLGNTSDIIESVESLCTKELDIRDEVMSMDGWKIFTAPLDSKNMPHSVNKKTINPLWENLDEYLPVIWDKKNKIVILEDSWWENFQNTPEGDKKDYKEYILQTLLNQKIYTSYETSGEDPITILVGNRAKEESEKRKKNDEKKSMLRNALSRISGGLISEEEETPTIEEMNKEERVLNESLKQIEIPSIEAFDNPSWVYGNELFHLNSQIGLLVVFDIQTGKKIREKFIPELKTKKRLNIMEQTKDGAYIGIEDSGGFSYAEYFLDKKGTLSILEQEVRDNLYPATFEQSVTGENLLYMGLDKFTFSMKKEDGVLHNGNVLNVNNVLRVKDFLYAFSNKNFYQMAIDKDNNLQRKFSHKIPNFETVQAINGKFYGLLYEEGKKIQIHEMTLTDSGLNIKIISDIKDEPQYSEDNTLILMKKSEGRIQLESDEQNNQLLLRIGGKNWILNVETGENKEFNFSDFEGKGVDDAEKDLKLFGLKLNEILGLDPNEGFDDIIEYGDGDSFIGIAKIGNFLQPLLAQMQYEVLEQVKMGKIKVKEVEVKIGEKLESLSERIGISNLDEALKLSTIHNSIDFSKNPKNPKNFKTIEEGYFIWQKNERKRLLGPNLEYRDIEILLEKIDRDFAIFEINIEKYSKKSEFNDIIDFIRRFKGDDFKDLKNEIAEIADDKQIEAINWNIASLSNIFLDLEKIKKIQKEKNEIDIEKEIEKIESEIEKLKEKCGIKGYLIPNIEIEDENSLVEKVQVAADSFLQVEIISHEDLGNGFKRDLMKIFKKKILILKLEKFSKEKSDKYKDRNSLKRLLERGDFHLIKSAKMIGLPARNTLSEIINDKSYDGLINNIPEDVAAEWNDALDSRKGMVLAIKLSKAFLENIDIMVSALISENNSEEELKTLETSSLSIQKSKILSIDKKPDLLLLKKLKNPKFFKIFEEAWNKFLKLNSSSNSEGIKRFGQERLLQNLDFLLNTSWTLDSAMNIIIYFDDISGLKNLDKEQVTYLLNFLSKNSNSINIISYLNKTLKIPNVDINTCFKQWKKVLEHHEYVSNILKEFQKIPDEDFKKNPEDLPKNNFSRQLLLFLTSDIDMLRFEENKEVLPETQVLADGTEIERIIHAFWNEENGNENLISAISKAQNNGKINSEVDKINFIIAYQDKHGIDVSSRKSRQDILASREAQSVEPGVNKRELPQNSLDSIEASGKSKGQIILDNYLQKNEAGESEYVESFSDNGSGIKDFLALLIPGYSDKNKKDLDKRGGLGTFGKGFYKTLQKTKRVEGTSVVFDEKLGVKKKYHFQLIPRKDGGVDLGYLREEVVAANRETGTIMKEIYATNNIIPELESMISHQTTISMMGLTQEFSIIPTSLLIQNKEKELVPVVLDIERISERDFITQEISAEKIVNHEPSVETVLEIKKGFFERVKSLLNFGYISKKIISETQNLERNLEKTYKVNKPKMSLVKCDELSSKVALGGLHMSALETNNKIYTKYLDPKFSVFLRKESHYHLVFDRQMKPILDRSRLANQDRYLPEIQAFLAAEDLKLVTEKLLKDSSFRIPGYPEDIYSSSHYFELFTKDSRSSELAQKISSNTPLKQDDLKYLNESTSDGVSHRLLVILGIESAQGDSISNRYLEIKAQQENAKAKKILAQRSKMRSQNSGKENPNPVVFDKSFTAQVKKYVNKANFMDREPNLGKTVRLEDESSLNEVERKILKTFFDTLGFSEVYFLPLKKLGTAGMCNGHQLFLAEELFIENFLKKEKVDTIMHEVAHLLESMKRGQNRWFEDSAENTHLTHQQDGSFAYMYRISSLLLWESMNS